MRKQQQSEQPQVVPQEEVKEEEIIDDGEEFELIDEEEQLRREIEARNKRWAEIKQRHAEQSTADGKVMGSTEQASGSNIDIQTQQIKDVTQFHQEQSKVETQNLNNTSGQQETPQIQKEEQKATTQKNDEFYKMLDKQREGWYQQEMTRQESLKEEGPKQEQQTPPKEKKGYDMFLESSDEENNLGQTIKKQSSKQQPTYRGFQVTVGQVDIEGYYQPKAGEIINNRYKIKSIAGKGVFSSVVKATDMNPVQLQYTEVAIKIIRMFDIMRQSGEKEREIVTMLNKADPQDKRHIIRLLDTFEYNNHLCLVYECMERNLRETLNKFGRGVGLSLDGVCSYGRQLFLALSLLHRLKLIHADLKPDNIMVTKDSQKIKLCDFGSCISVDEIGITEYMASRFYRAPEIMLGCKFNQAIDVWSAGVSLFELYTGKVMFPGRSNNEMLKLIMQTKGKIKSKLLKQGEFVDKHFDPTNQNVFLSQEEDPINKGQIYIKKMLIPAKEQRPIIQKLKSAHSAEEDPKALALFAEFLDKCLIIDPAKRITSDEALQHPFLNMLKERAAQQKK